MPETATDSYSDLLGEISDRVKANPTVRTVFEIITGSSPSREWASVPMWGGAKRLSPEQLEELLDRIQRLPENKRNRVKWHNHRCGADDLIWASVGKERIWGIAACQEGVYVIDVTDHYRFR
jgi:hypothetical protein